MKLDCYLKQNNKKHIVFDFDETLFTLHLPWVDYKKEMVKKLTQLDPSLYLKDENDLLTPLMNIALQKYGQKAKQIINNYSEFFESEHLQNVSMNQEILGFIRGNYMNYNFYIWSSNTSKTIHTILENNGLISFFKKVITQNEVSMLKPFPDGFNQIFDEKTQKKVEFVLIGDSTFDKNAAKNAGIEFLHVKNFS